MKYLILFVALISSLQATTIVSGTATRDYRAQGGFASALNQFNLTLSSGPITQVSAFHDYEICTYPCTYWASGFAVSTSPSGMVAPGVAYNFVLNGVTYSGSYNNNFNNMPNISLTYEVQWMFGFTEPPIRDAFGYSILKQFTGTLTAVVSGVSYSETFDGYASIGAYTPPVIGTGPFHIYTDFKFTPNPVEVPEPAYQFIPGMTAIILTGLFRNRVRGGAYSMGRHQKR